MDFTKNISEVFGFVLLDINIVFALLRQKVDFTNNTSDAFGFVLLDINIVFALFA